MKTNIPTTLCFIALATTANAEFYDELNMGDPTQHNKKTQVEVLDEVKSVVINGIKTTEEEGSSEGSLPVYGPSNGILVIQSPATAADFVVGFWDGAIESAGPNGVIGATGADSGIGVLGVNQYSGNAAVYGWHEPIVANGSGQGVRGLSTSLNGIGILGSNLAGGLAGRFEGGDVSQTLANNGIVKAWAKIRADGTVLSCYNCDEDPSVTFKVADGAYRVAFTPLGSDISARPRTATLDTHAAGTILGEIGLATDALNAAAVFVRTSDSAGTGTDKSFTIMIY